LRIVSFIKTAIILEYDAFKASKEALKEEGKLIVILTAKDICEVNKLKDKGYEPSIILKVKIDEMLIKLKR
jgi:tRNA1(Val) A37 N6-methylase TrmN6